MRVPYMARFIVYARKQSPEEFAVRVVCLTEPERADNPLESQEEFREICKSDDYVEVTDKEEVFVRFGGNLQKSAESEDRRLKFRPFSENRETFVVRRKNEKNPYPKGKVCIYIGAENVLFESKIDLSKFAA